MKKFSIPVNWEVWDKVEVEAETIEEAIQWLKDHIDEIPLGTEPEYIDGSYKIEDGQNGEASIEEAQIRNKEINEDLETIEYVLKKQGLLAMYKPWKCVHDYIVHLERENFGLKQSLENKERTLERLGGYLRR